MTPREVRLPYFKFYPEEWLSDGDILTLSDTGVRAFINLICHQWRAGPLPTDSRKLSVLSGVGDRWKTVEREVLALFTPRGNAYVYIKLEAERKNAEDTHAKYVEAGRKGGKSSTASSQGQARLKPGSSQAEVFSDAEAEADSEAEAEQEVSSQLRNKVNVAKKAAESRRSDALTFPKKSEGREGKDNGGGNGRDILAVCHRAKENRQITEQGYRSISNAVHDMIAGQPKNVRDNRLQQLAKFTPPELQAGVYQFNRDVRAGSAKSGDYVKLKRTCRELSTGGTTEGTN